MIDLDTYSFYSLSHIPDLPNAFPDFTELSGTINPEPKIELVEKHCDRRLQKDNFSIKLFTFLNNYIFKKNKDLIKKYKIHKPNYKAFTHNSNLVFIKFYLGLSYKNILQLTNETFMKLNELLIELGIKKKLKEKRSALNKDEENNAKIILQNFNMIKINENLPSIEIKEKYIEFLKKKHYKKEDEDELYKKDKDKMKDILIELKEKKSYHLQKSLDGIKRFDMTLEQIILEIYSNEEQFQELTEIVKEIDNNYKTYHSFSLLDREENGFLKMINQDCGLSGEQRTKLDQLLYYFKEKDLNIEEINNYKMLMGI
jgi:hypothetical protein